VGFGKLGEAYRFSCADSTCINGFSQDFSSFSNAVLGGNVVNYYRVYFLLNSALLNEGNKLLAFLLTRVILIKNYLCFDSWGKTYPVSPP